MSKGTLFVHLLQLLTLSEFRSVKQYRSHLKEWSFAKNVKDLDMRTIVRIMQWRKENEGKETQFRVQNRPVSRVNIVRFIKRKGLTTNTNTPHCTFVRFILKDGC